MAKNDFMTANIDPEKIAVILRDAAATYITPRFRTLHQGEVAHKAGSSDLNDLVTVADQETEIVLDGILSREFPGSIVIGEEGISSGQKGLATLKDKDRLVWVVDPVDGTQNFVNGIPQFALMLAAVRNGETVMGWIYDIPRNVMMMTQKGAGATIDGISKQIAGPAGMKNAKGLIDVFMPDSIKPQIDNFSNQAQQIKTLNCAGLHYLKILEGKVDFSFYRLCKPWDHLAGTLAVAEAGGISLTWNGALYTPTTNPEEGIISASNPGLMKDLQGKLVKSLGGGLQRKP